MNYKVKTFLFLKETLEIAFHMRKVILLTINLSIYFYLINFAVIPSLTSSCSSLEIREKSNDLSPGRFAIIVGLQSMLLIYIIACEV